MRAAVIGLCGWISLLPPVAVAETVLAATAIRAGSVLTQSDLKLSDVRVAGALQDTQEAVGRQTNRNLFPGHAIFAKDLQAPHLVQRNQLVTLRFRRGALTIATDGRAIDDGALGERIRVRNASSRTTVVGTVLADGSISVSGGMP